MWLQKSFVLKLFLLLLPVLFVTGISLASLLPQSETEMSPLVVVVSADDAGQSSALLAQPSIRPTIEVTTKTAVSINPPLTQTSGTFIDGKDLLGNPEETPDKFS